MIKKVTLFSFAFLLIFMFSFPVQSQTDTQGRGKVYQLMIKNMVELQKVIVAMAQNRWEAAEKEIGKQIEFAEKVLELYPEKTISDIRKYKKTARKLKEHAEDFKEYAAEKSEKKAQEAFCDIFSECLFCHSTFRD